MTVHSNKIVEANCPECKKRKDIEKITSISVVHRYHPTSGTRYGSVDLLFESATGEQFLIHASRVNPNERL